jgi:hypothetical protein
MPPTLPHDNSLAKLARRALVTAGPAVASHHLPRGLSVNHTQGVTLGVIGAYVVIIALLWNLPYVRWVLWPFKVRTPSKVETLVESWQWDDVLREMNDVCANFNRC